MLSISFKCLGHTNWLSKSSDVLLTQHNSLSCNQTDQWQGVTLYKIFHKKESQVESVSTSNYSLLQNWGFLSTSNGRQQDVGDPGCLHNWGQKNRYKKEWENNKNKTKRIYKIIRSLNSFCWVSSLCCCSWSFFTPHNLVSMKMLNLNCLYEVK